MFVYVFYVITCVFVCMHYVCVCMYVYMYVCFNVVKEERDKFWNF